jgi:predicted N-acetyltransferase YhbS
LIGMDTCCYKNNDLQRKEVRLEFGWFPEGKKRLNHEEIEVRMETKDDWYNVELMTQHAFWNKHNLGCDEHYLVHKLRQDKDYLPELSRIAVKEGDVIGCIMYSKARVVDGADTHEIITFGPLCVEPKWQGCGVGELLLRETMNLAANKGYKGIVIFGEPDYYPRIGFKTCDNFNITTADGKNFDAFMGLELAEDSMKGIKGKFYESEAFENLPKEEVEEYNKKFPQLQKLRFPGQWD